MRYLNKIIFLNSAHIPYAEVKLDGNVHFIGTQGVGKSTLLRALLFFYNADKLRLGIPKEKKSFDAFYFPYPNSYIVYEVMRENGAYCVLALKNQGRVMFRFIDAPFDSKWFIDERKQVYGEWSQIREQVGKKHDISSLVSSYEMYRDIISATIDARNSCLSASMPLLRVPSIRISPAPSRMSSSIPSWMPISSRIPSSAR